MKKKNTMPVLSNILIEADKNGLKVSATDLEVAIVCQVPAEVGQPGKITVHSRSMHDIVRELSQGDIHIQSKGNDRLKVIAGSSQFDIPGLSAGEFPSLPKVEGKSVEFPCEVILNIIEKTAFSMAMDDTRHNLSGILLEGLENNNLRAVATDGHRLSQVEIESPVKELKSTKVIIPRKGVAELKKLVSKEGSFELAVGKKNIFARKGNETLFIRLVDGEFPDYKRVIPEKSDKFATVSKSALVGALRRVSLLSNERSRGVVLSFSPGHLEVSISNPDLGEAREELDVDYRADSLSVGFNARYFLDVLDVIQDDEVIIALQSDLSPCIVKAEKESGFLYVIMPMRI